MYTILIVATPKKKKKKPRKKQHLDNVQLRYKEGQGRLSMLVGDMHMLG
jgi:hypothetical protein